MDDGCETFVCWMDKMIKDSREQLGMTDKMLADILLREGIACYHRSILGEGEKE